MKTRKPIGWLATWFSQFTVPFSDFTVLNIFQILKEKNNSNRLVLDGFVNTGRYLAAERSEEGGRQVGMGQDGEWAYWCMDSFQLGSATMPGELGEKLGLGTVVGESQKKF
jgi:hypothetical protein